MKILKTQVLRGPNIWSNYRKKLIQVKLDLEEMENFPTNKIDGFPQRIKTAFPGMIKHECSEGTSGGFFRRLERGTWLGHVIEHVALEIQSLAGIETGYGRTRSTGTKGVYNMVFAYEIEQAGLYTAQAAFRIVDAMVRNEAYDFEADISELKKLKRRYGLGPSTKSIVEEAERRGIPWQQLDNHSKIQLGYGKNQKQFIATMTCNTSATAVDIAADKDDTKRILAQAAIPVADGDICSTVEELAELIDEIGFPIVIKPLDGNQGKGASINVTDWDSAVAAFQHAQQYSAQVVVEKYVSGVDFRFLVIDGKFIAASRRIPAHVIGDGQSNMRELVDAVNRNPNRGDGHESVLTKITLDKDAADQLEKQNYNYDSVPAAGEQVFLKSTANLSTGGTAIDVTADVHPCNQFMAERIAGIIGLDICGIDVMAPNISEPLTENGGVVLEVNAAPGFRMHLCPSEGQPRNVAKAVVDMLYPLGSESRIPIFAITGTNGKTTTTRLLAHIAKGAGFTPGYTTTDGIYIGEHKIQTGDTTGPVSAGIILRDPKVDFAVLETARGGIVRSGLCFDHSDIGIITNIQGDHLGLNDINTLEDLANVKAVVARSVKENGWAVLNAEDTHCVKITGELDCNIAYFGLVKNDLIAEHIATGGLAAFVEDHHIVVQHGAERTIIDQVQEIPLTQKGAAKFMIANVLAATAASFAYGFTKEQIRSAMRTLKPCYEQTPGRMNLFEFNDFKVLVDYAHNPHGLLGIKDYLKHVKAARKIGIVAGIGDRRDQDILELAALAATMFDHIIIRQEHGLRGRTVDEINALMVQGIESANTGVSYDLVPEETEAIKHALQMAGRGDFIVALSDVYPKVIEIIKEAQQQDNKVLSMPVITTSWAS
jgi:cyanophycin synthetase